MRLGVKGRGGLKSMAFSLSVGPIDDDGSDSDDDEFSERSHFALEGSRPHLFQDMELLSRFLVLTKETELSLTIFGVRVTPLWTLAASLPTIMFTLYRVTMDP